MRIGKRSSHGRRLGLVPAFVLGGAIALAGMGTSVAEADTAPSPFVQSIGSLADLQPGTANPTDGAQARFYAVPAGSQTTAVLVVTGINDSVGTSYGAHVHVGPCVAGNGGAAGPHFRSPATAAASPTTEVWLDFTVLPGGYGVASTTVPFVIPAGAAQSVVIHATPTAPDGSAGARMACLPVAF